MKYDLGVLGGGQLARMSIQAAQRMGFKCVSLDAERDTPASQVAPALQGSLDDPEKIAEVLRSCRRVTLENEFIPADSIRKAQRISNTKSGALIPNVETLATIQDKLLQRHALTQAGVPAPKAVSLDSDPTEAIKEIGFPMVLKARFGGYDGKGIRYARDMSELQSYESLWKSGGWLAEQFVKFTRELSVIVFISEWGAGCFPTMETVQKNHVCDLVFPCDADGSQIAIAAVESVGGAGLFGVELFDAEGGPFVNEIAPRPHNTGHYTLDWGSISQFEQHVRSVLSLPLGRPQGYHQVCMANLLGRSTEGDVHAGLRAALAEPDTYVHWYGKAEMRVGRKMGHLNAVGRPDEPLTHLVARATASREKFFEAL